MKSFHGFTLMEVLTALTISVILGAVAVQGIQALLNRGQDEALQNELMQLMLSARSEADTRHRTISICPSNDLHACGGDWSNSQIMFIDDAEDGRIHQQDQILAVHQMTSRRGILQFKFYPRYRHYLQFHPTLTDSNDNGTLWYCRNHASYPAWAIAMSKSGECHALPKDSNNQIKGSDGKVLECQQS